MRPFIHEDFLLGTDEARALYHAEAASLPIIDYHCHLDPEAIAEDRHFEDIVTLWLGGDHYKWRAMRANGIPEEFITGARPPFEKFLKWAETLPYLFKNPLYHWTHLELKRVFGIDTLLTPRTARDIYEACNELLRREDFGVQGLLRRFRVELVCTTDDPADELSAHARIRKQPFGTRVIPAWRPDKAMAVEDPAAYILYMERLGRAAGQEIRTLADLLEVLSIRHRFFHEQGCRLSDHGLETFYAADCGEKEAGRIFARLMSGQRPEPEEALALKSFLLERLAVMDAEAGWTQQFHIGALRNCHGAMFSRLGPDTGYDAIHDLPQAAAGNRFLDRLASQGKLAKTILYSLNPAWNEVFLTMAGNFNDGSVPGKLQYGAAWWFLDTESGMRKQLEDLGNLGLLRRFVGMLTDSRSFISYPRHEYFRRILCDILGQDIATGRIPREEMGAVQAMVAEISYHNAKRYFDF